MFNYIATLTIIVILSFLYFSYQNWNIEHNMQQRINSYLITDKCSDKNSKIYLTTSASLIYNDLIN